MLNLAHEGQQGIYKSKQRLRSKVSWPRLDEDGERICKSCESSFFFFFFFLIYLFQQVEVLPVGSIS